jgi:hypothetical protein
MHASVWARGVTVTLAFLTTVVRGADAGRRPTDACRSTTEAAFRACKGEARGDEWLALGKCDNVPGANARKTCRRHAAAEAQDTMETCRAQRAARRDVCAHVGAAPYAPVIDPANFVVTVDNPYFPLTPGTKLVYEGQTAAGLEHSEFLVTHNTRVILGVTCVEVHDVVQLNGKVTEDTVDWFAQDEDGNVWYFGENSREVDGDLVISLEGSWTAGVDGAQPGIVMEAQPAVGDVYRQEFLLGEAEDVAEVEALAEPVTVIAGSFPQCLKTKDIVPLEPDAVENKFYAPGVGNVLTVDLETGERFELVQITTE